MRTPRQKNIPASIRQRLLNYARCHDENFQAIKATFSCRGSDIPGGEPIALTSAFFKDSGKQTQWQAFLSKGSFKVKEEKLENIIRVLRQFLLKPLKAVNEGSNFKASWKNGGPWQKLNPDSLES